MKLPYLYRIMAALPGHEPVELLRLPSRRTFPHDIRSATDSLDPAWHWWIESPCSERKLLAPRHVFAWETRARKGK